MYFSKHVPEVMNFRSCFVKNGTNYNYFLKSKTKTNKKTKIQNNLPQRQLVLLPFVGWGSELYCFTLPKMKGTLFIPTVFESSSSSDVSVEQSTLSRKRVWSWPVLDNHV